MVTSKANPVAEWSVNDEIKLFQALRHNKPVGVNKHFAILKVVDQLKTSLGRAITCDEVWAYINTMYDVTALDEFETVPFPNDISDFCLPENEFPEIASDINSESDQKTESLDTDVSFSETKVSKSRGHHSDKSVTEEHTPKRLVKRTRASSGATTPSSDTPTTSKRRRV